MKYPFFPSLFFLSVLIFLGAGCAPFVSTTTVQPPSNSVEGRMQPGIVNEPEAMKKEAPSDSQAMMKKEAIAPTGTVMLPKAPVMEKQPAGMGEAMKKEVGMRNGAYESYAASKLALAKDGKVVLFFHAPWCPTCRVIDSDIRSHVEDIPKNFTILQVDYDSSTELKRAYGVTYQHTFVQVDEQGRLLEKWSGSPTLAELVTHVK